MSWDYAFLLAYQCMLSPSLTLPCIVTAEHDPSLITDSPSGSIASSLLSRATAAGRSGGNSVERLLYKALRGLAEQVGEKGLSLPKAVFVLWSAKIMPVLCS